MTAMSNDYNKNARNRGNVQTYYPQVGLVTSIDQAAYRAKVKLLLLDVETEWVRIATSYVGQGWGAKTMVHVGNEVLVNFVNGDLNDGIITGVLYSDEVDTPPTCPEDVCLVHESGTTVILKKDGDISVDSVKNIQVTAKKVDVKADDVNVEAKNVDVKATLVEVNAATVDVKATSVEISAGNISIISSSGVAKFGDDISLAADKVTMAGGGHAVARVGDTVEINCTTCGVQTGKITKGSDKVSCG